MTEAFGRFAHVNPLQRDMCPSMTIAARAAVLSGTVRPPWAELPDQAGPPAAAAADAARHAEEAEATNSPRTTEVTYMTAGRGQANSRDALRALPNREPPDPEPAAHERALRTLSPADCFDLLEPGGIGRVGFTSADGITMLPVNFAVTGKTIIFRTAPDTLLALYADAQVSFEVDHLDGALHEGWSVLVHGHARKITDEREVKRLEDGTHLEPWAGGARDVYVRIAATRISGRRIQPGWASPPVEP